MKIEIFLNNIPLPDTDGLITDKLLKSHLSLSEDEHYRILTVETENEIQYDLRIVSFDNSEYFEWINESGDPVGGVFDQINSDLLIETSNFLKQLN